MLFIPLLAILLGLSIVATFAAGYVITGIIKKKLHAIEDRQEQQQHLIDSMNDNFDTWFEEKMKQETRKIQ